MARGTAPGPGAAPATARHVAPAALAAPPAARAPARALGRRAGRGGAGVVARAVSEGPVIAVKGEAPVVGGLLTAERKEVVASLEDFAEEKLLKLLMPAEKCWQPQVSGRPPGLRLRAPGKTPPRPGPPRSRPPPAAAGPRSDPGPTRRLTRGAPQDYLPDPSSPTFIDEVRALRERTAELPDDFLVVLVGDMVTEEALPT